LTIYGKSLVDAYNRYGMIVDVSHTGERTAMDAIEHSKDPVISSHSGAKAIRDYPRGQSDELIKAVGQSGGVQCINTVGGFMDPSNPDVVTTDIIFQHIDHIVNLIGIDHVGYGSDFIPDVYWTAESGQTPMADILFPDPDGKHMFPEMCKKGVPTPAPYQFIAALVDKMLEKGYSEEDCGKVIGGNAYRLFKQVWK
jgi:membrane dipeptidase